MSDLISYAFKDNRLYHISEVETGVNCGCICKNCGSKLVAKNSLTENRKNKKNFKEIHFAHFGDECLGAYESMLHHLVKDVIQKILKLRVPDFHGDYNPDNKNSLFKKGRVVKFEKIISEDDENTTINKDGAIVKPDIICFTEGKVLYVEVANSHFVDKKKSFRIKTLELPVIEIDVRQLKLEIKDEINRKNISNFLLKKSPLIYWLNNPTLKKEYDLEKELAINEIINLLKPIAIIYEAELKLFLIEEAERKKKREEKKSDEEKRNKILQLEHDELILKSLKNSQYYNHPILKKIIDNPALWNGTKDCNFIDGWVHFIFIANEKYIWSDNKNKYTRETKDFGDCLDMLQALCKRRLISSITQDNIWNKIIPRG
jgi:hypothetical protein